MPRLRLRTVLPVAFGEPAPRRRRLVPDLPPRRGGGAAAHTIQERTFGMRNLAMDAVVALIEDLARRRAAGASEAELAAAWKHQRKAQFLLDFVEAENSMGFHADQEAMRILALSIDSARLGQLVLRDPGAAPPAIAAQDPLEEHTPGG